MQLEQQGWSRAEMQSRTALPRGTAGSPRPARPGRLGLVLTKHSLIRCVCPVTARVLSLLHPRKSVQAQKVPQEACGEKQRLGDGTRAQGRRPGILLLWARL